MKIIFLKHRSAAEKWQKIEDAAKYKDEGHGKKYHCYLRLLKDGNMKILFVANYMWDIYIFRGGLLKALVADGHEVVAAAPDNGRIDMEKAIPGLKSVSITLNKRGINPMEDMKLTYDLYKLYKKRTLILYFTTQLNLIYMGR